MALNKTQLEVVNQTNFPNNNGQLITPALLREFNTDVIASLQLQDTAATTGSNTFVGNQIVSGNVDITGTLTAYEIHTIIESSSIIYSSGSNQLGDALSDTQILSGSVYIVGSGSLNGNRILTTADTASLTFNTSSLVTTASFNAYTQSTNLRLNSLETTSQSLNQFTASQIVSNSYFATTGSNTFNGNQSIAKEYHLNTNGIYWNDSTAGYNNLEIINSAYGNVDISAINGRVRVINSPLFLTGSAITSSNDISTSANIYAANLTGSGGTINTGSFATTGSNTFVGAQTITGSNGKLVYSGTNQADISLASIHANNDEPWLERFYNDTFSTSSAVMAYFAWNDGRFVFHNESTQSIGIGVNGDYNNPELLVYEDKAVIKNDLFVSGNVYAANLTGSGGNIDTSSFATTGSNTFIGNQSIEGNLTFPSGAFISTTNTSGALWISSLNGGNIGLNADGGEGDVLVGYTGWNGKLKVRGNSEFTGSIYQSGTFWADQIDVSLGGIIQNTGSYVATFSSSGLLTYDTYQNVAAALQTYIQTGSAIDTASFATTGSNSFTGSQTILSGSIAVLNNGNAASLNETELNIETYTSDAYGIIAANNHSASLGIVSWDGATYDNELWIQADNSGIQLTDWDNGLGNISTVPFLSIGANTGSQPAPIFNRGLVTHKEIKGTGSINLQPDQTDARFIEIYNTAATDTHITASGGNLFLGNDETFVLVTTYANQKELTLRGDAGIHISGSITSSNDISSSGNLIVNTITASAAQITYLHTIYESSSVIYSSGSNQLGDELTDIQILSGSVQVVGGLTLNGVSVSTQSVDISALNSFTASQYVSNSYFATTSSVNNLSASIYQTDSTQSNNIATNSSSIGLLQTFSGSQYKNDSSSFDSRIIAATGSTINTGSFATTGSNSFTGSQTINGDIILTGSSAEIQNAKGVGFFNSLYNLDYSLSMPIQNTIGYIDELGLPHYYNGGVQPTISASAALSNHNLVKVTPQEWFNLTASVGDNHTGILSVEQSTGWDDINNTFGLHGNALSSGSVNYITQRGLSKVGIFKMGGSPVEPYIGQPVYVSDNGYQLQAGYPSGSRVLRYGYVASFEQTDPGNMYVRQIYVDPVWEKGETITDLNVSSSLRVTGSLNVTGSTNFSELTGSLSTFSASIYQTDTTQSNNISSNSSSIGLLQTFSGSQYKNDSSSFDSRIIAAGGQSQIQDEGTILGNVTSFNFLGAGVTASVSAGTASVTIAGGGGTIDTGSFITTGSITNSQTIFGNLTVSRSAGSGQNAIDAQGNAYVTDTLKVGALTISGSGETGANNMLYPTTLWQSSGNIKFNNYLNVPDPAYTGSITFTATSGSGIRFTGNGGAVVNVNGVIIGSGPSDNAIAIGSASMQSNTGANSIGIGNASLQLNRSSANVAVGNFTLQYQQFTGNGQNTAIGHTALNFLGSGSAAAAAQLNSNTAVGNSAGASLIVGARNTFIGNTAGTTADNVERMTGIGRGTLSVIGSNSVVNGSGSKYNTAIGHNALFQLQSGSNNTFIHGGSVSGEGFITGSNNTIMGMDAGLPSSMEANTIIGRSIAGLSSPLSNNVIIADGQGNIALQKNGSSGLVIFPTGLEVTGSLFVSSSNTSDIVVNGQVFISSSVSSSAGIAKLTISGSTAGSTGRAAQVVIVPTSVTLTRATTSGTQTIALNSTNGDISLTGPTAAIVAAITTGSNQADISAVYAVGAIDNEVHLSADANGIYLQDWDNTALSYSPWLSIGPNDGVTIPPVKFQRAVNFTTGSNQQAGTATLNGGNPGTVTVSNSLVTSNSIIMLTKQTLGNAHSVAITAKSGGSFTITSTGNGDSDVVGWFIINNS